MHLVGYLYEDSTVPFQDGKLWFVSNRHHSKRKMRTLTTNSKFWEGPITYEYIHNLYTFKICSQLEGWIQLRINDCITWCISVKTLIVYIFLGTFAKLRKAAISFVMSVRPSAWYNSPPNWRIFTKFYIWVFFRKTIEKIQVALNRTRITGTLYADQYTYFITSGSVLLRMRNVSDTSCRENQNTHFVSNTFFSKIVPFETTRGKNCRAVQATDDNRAHAHCMLNT